MRMRPLILAVAGVLSVGLASGTASAAAPATFTATATAWGTGPLFAYINAKAALNAKYTGCTNIVIISSLPSGSGWVDTVQGTCTGTA
jgi:ABC-type glycerol-3-phosphate transport system substrate-binding protein